MAVSAKDIRNVALIGHSGEGKTTLAEAILYNTRAIDRQGRTDDGNTTMDFDAEEIARKISISLAVANCNYKGVKINLIDVPGYFDFESEMLMALSAADSAVIVTSASGTLTVGTEKALEYCLQNKIPAIIFVNGVDKENSSFPKTLAAITEKFPKVVPVVVPQMDGGKMTGSVNVVNNTSDNFSHLGIYDEYTSDGVTIYINKANGELMFLSDNKIDRTAEGDFTAEEAVKDAEEILVLLYGKEVFEYYGEPVLVDKVAENNINGAQQYVLKVVYEKNVLGYRTDDRITVKFNMEGKLVSVNAMKRNTMSRVEQDITKEQVDTALSVLIEQIPDDKIESLRISVAADGNYYITADVIRYLSMHPAYYPLRFSINIQ